MRALVAGFAALAVSFGSGFAATIGDAMHGKELAQRWCASCHLVSPEQTSATTEAPPFATIAERPAEENAKLDLWLQDPHPPMPQLNLSRTERADLIAYIESLKQAK